MDKRAHHNALERRRRDHIKDSFTGLRDAIPTMRGGDKSSRAQILKKASEYIQVSCKKLRATKVHHFPVKLTALCHETLSAARSQI